MSFNSTYLSLFQYSKGISFDEPSHTYYYKNRTMTSVTTAVGNCFPRFDRGGSISIGLAEKRGITVKELKDEWRHKAELGTKVHNYCEQLVNNINFISDDPWCSIRVEYAQDFIQESGIKPLFCEFPVYNGKFSIAGTCDLLTYNAEEDCIDIYDWKTNDSIVGETVKFGKYGFGRLCGIPDTNFWHYALQLSIYKYILQEAGFKVGKLNLVHLTDSGYKVIELPYLSDEALYILESNL